MNFVTFMRYGKKYFEEHDIDVSTLNVYDMKSWNNLMNMQNKIAFGLFYNDCLLDNIGVTSKDNIKELKRKIMLRYMQFMRYHKVKKFDDIDTVLYNFNY